MHDPLGSNFALHRPFYIPNVFVLSRHVCSIEAGVEVGDGDALWSQLLGHQDAAHVCRGLAHVVSVVSTLVAVLDLSPECATALGGDVDHLGAGGEGRRGGDVR